MTPFRLSIAALLLIPALLLSWLTLTQSGLQWTLQQAETYLPENLSWQQLQGRLVGPVTIKGLQYQQDGSNINADQITLDWSPTSLLTANININKFHIQSLSIVVTKTDETSAQAAGQEIMLPEISLPWRLALNNVQLDDLIFSQNNRVFKLTKISLNATSLLNRINIKQLSITADKFKLDINGRLQPTRDYPHTLDVNWQFALANSQLITGKGQLSGSMQETRLKQNISGALQLTLDSKIKNLLKQPDWSVKADLNQFDLNKLDTSWPALSGAALLNAEGDLHTATLTGELNGHYPELGALHADVNLQRLANNTVQIAHLQLQAPEHNTQLDTKGFWTPGDHGGNISLALNWQNLSWPGDTPHWFSSAEGSATIEGNINAYEITLDTDSPWPQLSPSRWHASAAGNADGMTFKNLRINALNGEANVSGQLNWSPQLNWQAEAVLAHIDPAARWPQWPGRLDGKLSSNGHLQEGQLFIDTDISQLKGKLRGYPVSLHSRLAWQDEHLQITQLEFLSGKSIIRLNGQLGETLKLDWSLNSTNLAELYPQAEGQLQAQGTLKGAREKPYINASFNGKALAYSNLEAGNVEASLAVDLHHWQKIDVTLQAKTLRYNDHQLQSLNIDADSQQIKTQVVSEPATANITLTGETSTTGWRGHITQAEIETTNYDNWRLQQAAALTFSENTLDADTFCLHNQQAASLCASLEGNNKTWRSQLKMQQLPLKLLQPWLPADLMLESFANGSAQLELASAEQLLANINIELPAGSLSYPMLEGMKDQRGYRGGKLYFKLNPQGLEATSELTMLNGDHFLAQLELPGLKPLAEEQAEQAIKASFQLRAEDLRLIESFIPDIQALQGKLNLNIIADGTVEQPILRGQANILDGSLQIPRLGLNIDQLSLNSQSDNNKKYSFRLNARSGDGDLVISGHTKLDKAAGWPTEINIKGNEFEASRIPEARLLVSPDVQIQAKDRRIDITGKVHIPYAKLQPKDVSQAAKVSSDSIIVGGEQTVEEKWLIHTGLRLTLGERVHFYGFGFEGRFGGSLLLQDKPGQLTSAIGEITVPEGIYRAYGQRLEIENGRILYTGGPLSNPGLDLRAVRKVNDIIAGIHVKGSLSQPQLEIFSNPAMGQTDALAYIILGGPIESASNEDGAVMAKAALALGLSGGDSIARSLGDRFGLDEMRVDSSNNGDQASLVVGRYLSPKLYASYGVGLIEKVNTLTLRYQISKKWQLKVESGGYQGADMLYTFER